MTSFKIGLPSSSLLYQSLTKKEAMTIDDLMDRIEKYAKVEDVTCLNAGENGRAKLTTKGSEKTENQKKGGKNGGKNGSKNGGNHDVLKTFQAVNTVFKEPIYKILAKIKDEPFIKWPQKMGGDPSKRNNALRCAFQKEGGHKIEHCKALKSHLEELAQSGHLSDFVEKRTEKVAANREARPDNVLEDDAGHEFAVIHGASDIKQIQGNSARMEVKKLTAVMQAFQIDPAKSESGKRRRAEDVNYNKHIVFTDEDLVGVRTPHHDALVITLRIANFDIDKFLVDQGSSSEVMYLDLFRKLKLSVADLKEATVTLVGFAGKMTMPLGKIVLPVRAGNVSKMIEFLVVDIDSPYQAILGRGWLHAMKAVSSTYHQKLKYVTEQGVMEIHDDQAMARRCFIAAIRPKPEKKIGQPSKKDEEGETPSK